MSFGQELHDPVTYAIPVFLLFMGLELLALRHLDDEEAGAGRYEGRDTRTNVLMGAGSLVVNGVARVVALLGYAALYVLAPWHLDSGNWATWLGAIIAVDLLFYL